MQINVETRFLLVNQDWFEQIGFDLSVYWNANNNQVRAARAVDPTILPSDFFAFDRRQAIIGQASGTGLRRNITGATFNVLNLVEGAAALVESPTNAFDPMTVHYAETFVVPAAVGPYRIRPLDSPPSSPLATIKAYVRSPALR